ncbi:TetR/AcrR family transcriptional regulator [Agromyces sp. SYSU K20354]|uniref:TetR/AcrR family transcriptional regulator n=1 Tax=Agromyces cavernae TaxID=2898659 RepID=UPI001E2D566B|nr:TetR/AcrR family transcriptional regulator [Agromyces cavernae]MCD2443048.1 TetR/AcrR family transcriptional regulator [Agromyces cavernae]
MARRQEVPQEIRQNLARHDLTSAAITLIERDGLNALTMRRLASELDCAPMSLYTHVRSRDDLIDAIVAHLIERLDLREPSGESWQQLIRQTLDSYRDLAVQLPNSFELLALAPYGSSPVAPHLGTVVARLEQTGLAPEHARQILGIVDAYASGFLVVWARSRAQGPLNDQLAAQSGITGLRDLEMFDQGLDALIAGLDATLVRGGPSDA